MMLIRACSEGMLLMSSSSVIPPPEEEVDFFREGVALIFPPPATPTLNPGLVELPEPEGDPGEAMDSIEPGEKT